MGRAFWTAAIWFFASLACGSSTTSGGAMTPGDGGLTGVLCASICPSVVAAKCAHGPATEAECESGCQTIQLGTCADQYDALYRCAGPTPVYACDGAGFVAVVGCETQQAALTTCLAGGG